MRLTAIRPLVLVPAVLLVAACGGESSGSGSSGASEQESSDPAVALAEAGATRKGLQQALATYQAGDAAAAEDQVAETYLQHFEKVEGALEAKDEELNERLEETINGDLRAQMKAQKPAAQVQRTVEGVVADLQAAEGLLR
jgi:UDP-N-acetylmuramyl pentapeptide synthase